MKHILREHELKNGAKVLFIEAPGAQTTSINAYFRSGYAYAADKATYEVPHVMEHMMLSGNKLYPDAVSFKVEVQKNGALQNAHTGQYLNDYVYTCAADEAERIVHLLAAQVSSPLFPEKSFKTEVGNVREELSRNTSNYERLSHQLVQSQFIPNIAQTDETRLGTLDAIKLEDLKAHYNRTHTAKNLRIVIAGAIPQGPQHFVDLLNASLSGLPQGQLLEIPKVPTIDSLPVVVEPKPIKQLYYTLYSYLSRPLIYEEMLAGQILRRLFRGRYDSWVLKEARERGLAYHVGVAGDSGPVMSSLGFRAYVTPKNAEELFKLFTKYFIKAKAGDFTQREVDEACVYVQGLLKVLTQTTDHLADWYGSDYITYERIFDFDKYVHDLATVTKDDVVKFANLITSEKRWGLSLVGDIDQKLGETLHQTVAPIWE